MSEARWVTSSFVRGRILCSCRSHGPHREGWSLGSQHRTSRMSPDVCRQLSAPRRPYAPAPPSRGGPALHGFPALTVWPSLFHCCQKLPRPMSPGWLLPSHSVIDGVSAMAQEKNLRRRWIFLFRCAAVVAPVPHLLLRHALTARRAASAVRETRCGTPSSSRAAPVTRAACRLMPPRCYPAQPTAARRNRSNCRPSQDRRRA